MVLTRKPSAAGPIRDHRDPRRGGLHQGRRFPVNGGPDNGRAQPIGRVLVNQGALEDLPTDPFGCPRVTI